MKHSIGLRMAAGRSTRIVRAGSCAVVVLSVLAVVFSGAPASAAASTFTASQEFPIALTAFVPCAAGGTGEAVVLSGSLHDLFHVTLDSHGGFLLVVLDNPQGVTGLGQTTGTKYQATGSTRLSFYGSVGFTLTYNDNFLIIGQGTGDKLRVKVRLHLTVNANGTLTSVADNESVTC